jgi:hypothetical protein
MVPADILFMTTSGLLYHDFIHLFFVYVHREVDDVDRKIPLRISRIHSHTLGCSGVEITLPPPNMFISHVVYYAETRWEVYAIVRCIRRRDRGRERARDHASQGVRKVFEAGSVKGDCELVAKGVWTVCARRVKGRRKKRVSGLLKSPLAPCLVLFPHRSA